MLWKQTREGGERKYEKHNSTLWSQITNFDFTPKPHYSYLFQLLYTILPASKQHRYLISHCCHQTLANIGLPPPCTWLSQTTTLRPSWPIDHQLLVAVGHHPCFPPLIAIIIGNLMQLNGIILFYFIIIFCL